MAAANEGEAGLEFSRHGIAPRPRIPLLGDGTGPRVTDEDLAAAELGPWPQLKVDPADDSKTAFESTSTHVVLSETEKTQPTSPTATDAEKDIVSSYGEGRIRNGVLTETIYTDRFRRGASEPYSRQRTLKRTPVSATVANSPKRMRLLATENKDLPVQSERDLTVRPEHDSKTNRADMTRAAARLSQQRELMDLAGVLSPFPLDSLFNAALNARTRATALKHIHQLQRDMFLSRSCPPATPSRVHYFDLPSLKLQVPSTVLSYQGDIEALKLHTDIAASQLKLSTIQRQYFHGIMYRLYQTCGNNIPPYAAYLYNTLIDMLSKGCYTVSSKRLYWHGRALDLAVYAWSLSMFLRDVPQMKLMPGAMLILQPPMPPPDDGFWAKMCRVSAKDHPGHTYIHISDGAVLRPSTAVATSEPEAQPIARMSDMFVSGAQRNDVAVNNKL